MGWPLGVGEPGLWCVWASCSVLVPACCQQRMGCSGRQPPSRGLGWFLCLIADKTACGDGQGLPREQNCRPWGLAAVVLGVLWQCSLLSGLSPCGTRSVLSHHAAGLVVTMCVYRCARLPLVFRGTGCSCLPCSPLPCCSLEHSKGFVQGSRKLLAPLLRRPGRWEPLSCCAPARLPRTAGLRSRHRRSASAPRSHPAHKGAATPHPGSPREVSPHRCRPQPLRPPPPGRSLSCDGSPSIPARPRAPE